MGDWFLSVVVSMMLRSRFLDNNSTIMRSLVEKVLGNKKSYWVNLGSNGTLHRYSILVKDQ